jgi:hypothetical protein
MAKKARRKTVLNNNVIDCACLIHDVRYSWQYVDKLYNSLCRNLTPAVRLHVYTEHNRAVPAHMIHHALEEWPGVRGPKKSWWHKIQLFNPKFHTGPLLYFDLDTVITGNIDWIWRLSTDRFWAVKDFKFLFRPSRICMNSSVMWFDPSRWSHVYYEFDQATVRNRGRYHGDQDYINEKIPPGQISYFDVERVKSWRWQVKDGGYDFKIRKYKMPGLGTILDNQTNVLIFHGDPKPHEIQDPNVLQYWI